MKSLEDNVIVWSQGIKDAMQRRLSSGRVSSIDQTLQNACNAFVDTVHRIVLEDLSFAQTQDLGNVLMDVIVFEVVLFVPENARSP